MIQKIKVEVVITLWDLVSLGSLIDWDCLYLDNSCCLKKADGCFISWWNSRFQFFILSIFKSSFFSLDDMSLLKDGCSNRLLIETFLMIWSVFSSQNDVWTWKIDEVEDRNYRHPQFCYNQSIFIWDKH